MESSILGVGPSIRTPHVGDRVRIALHHDGVWRPLLWLRVGSDGSVYVGLLVGAPSTCVRGQQPVSQGSATVSYSKGEVLHGEALPTSSRVSFKASGEIHLGSKVHQGLPLASLRRSLQLCLAVFVHPSRYRPPAKKNKNDYDLGIRDYPLDEGCPLYGALFVSPWHAGEAVSRIPVENMVVQRDVMLAFAGLNGTPDLALQVALGHGPAGSWPRLPAIAVRLPK